jgi:hypothetical protein
MQTTDRTEFDVQMAHLCAGFNVPLGDRPSAYWLGLAKMELATFARVVQHALGEEGPEKIPTVGQCWALSKQLRAARLRPAIEPERPQWQGDKWDIDANHHLLVHLRNHPKKYAPDSSYGPVRYGETVRNEAIPGPLTREYTEILVRWKKTWAEDMRVLDKPNAEVAWGAWCECMERADEQIAALSQEAAA